MHPTSSSQSGPRAAAPRVRGGRATRPRTRAGGDGQAPCAAPHSRERRRPARRDIERAARDLFARRGTEILATARRYAATADDADDACQRGFEILLTKAPTINEQELVPWLKTVVKHEAFALGRQRGRLTPVTDDGELGDRATPAGLTHDQAERYEQLRQGAEALRQLKPQESRALQLRAEGYSYAEISQLTGWTHTKINRCLTEGREALAIRLAGIRGGIECALLAPRLAALADAEADADDPAALGPHLQSCLSCRATLKQLRSAPARRSPASRLRRHGGDSLLRPPAPGPAPRRLSDGEDCRDPRRRRARTQT